MPIVFVLFTVVAGVMSGLQSGSNNTLQKALSAPWWTIVVVSAITLVAALVAAVAATPFTGERWPAGQAFATVPWHGWIGGLFGLGFVLATVFASPKLGAGMFVALVVTASTTTSLLLDNWGLMGFDVHHAGWGRIAGALCMVAGVTLIALF